MKVSTIKRILKPLGCLAGINLYQDEPTPSVHCISIEKGKATLAIDTLNQIESNCAYHAYGFGPYTESINVRRKKL